MYKLLAVIYIVIYVTGCGGKEVPVLQAVDTENNKYIVLSGDKTRLKNFYSADFVVLGGSLGGIAAALSLSYSGRTVLLVEESDRLVGCLTPGDTVCFMDNRYTETTGSSETYREFRSRIREWYKRNSEVPPDIPDSECSIPPEFGIDCSCFDADAVLEAAYGMLQKKIDQEFITVIHRQKAATAVTYQKRIASLITVDLDSLHANQLTGWMFIDATRTGDTLPLLGLDYSAVPESKAETNEPHAPAFSESLSAQEEYCFYDPEDVLANLKGSRCLVFDLFKSTNTPDNNKLLMVLKEPLVSRDPRRLRGYKTVAEHDISAGYNEGPRARFFTDSVGIGFQPIIIESSGGVSGKSIIKTKPFQIPLGALIPQGFTNLLAGGGNISATGITSSALGTPAVEWAVGEAAGMAAAYCAGLKIFTDELAGNSQHVKSLQERLVSRRGVPVYWYDDVTPYDDDFVEAQMKPFSEPGFHESLETLSYRKR